MHVQKRSKHARNTADTEPRDAWQSGCRLVNRRRGCLTQSALAREIKVETEMVINWETGRRHPNRKHQRALEKFFRIPSGGLALEMTDILAQDFSAAYFGDPHARERLEWADKNLQLGQALRIIPILPKT